mmetsp:Transcript_25869/g.71037  ORF Transcript_25869/g.71037 Transcript_25869/m.71037 type:complete len:929 (-) Transcript_25869:412-3198(-)|eukprot:CAMPEP_0172367662 /NCGR_PEP_ID=MMETSP1060-20121228/22936_1 /TAXON_ID=37318 /ORGANISM="Pseudo-nitzschia pungens, Strain cf. cingulata" /LENGTH=928 /DNA_ID=CAMNT_0013091993 /DNA_START=147 /DNA_END=2933 /DNA_ORIENTATION=-
MFLNKKKLLFIPLLLSANGVQGLFSAKAKLPDIFGNNNGLLARTINTQAPTSPRPTEPTFSPTESPAPSPSPSENPTKDPLRMTEPPTDFPTESPAPSPSPSKTPTEAPSPSPSAAPSAAPTISSAPSASPTATPSAMPSDFPSLAPSMEPTVSAAPSSAPTVSAAPSASPSAPPTGFPSAAPSVAPSYSPTSVTHRTKTAVASLLLEEIAYEMDAITMAEFELFTLDFLKRKIAPQDDYGLNTLAVTVLTQKTVYPEAFGTNETAFRKRKLESEDWNVGLQVDIRTVSVVTDGRVPTGFNLTEVVLLTFYDQWDQYLYQLGNTVNFFNPLLEVSDWVPVLDKAAVDDEDKPKGAFATAIVFSFVAFSLAVYASFVAIRKHLDGSGAPLSARKRRNRKGAGTPFSPKNSLNYSGEDVLNYLTQTMSDDKGSPAAASYHDGDIEGGGALAFVRNVNIDIDEHGMESIALTPRAKESSPTAFIRDGLFVVNEGSDDDKSPLRSPLARSPVEGVQAQSSAKKIGGQIKKWLTPRGIRYAPAADANRRLSTASDPPENQSTIGYNYGKQHTEPDAYKASTKNQAGVFTTDKSTIDGRSKATGISYNKKPSDEGQFTLPVSFFSNRNQGTDADGPESPMSSLADSNNSSFYAMDNMNKQFTGHRSEAGEMEDEGYEVSAQKISTASIMRPKKEKLPSVNDENTPDVLSPMHIRSKSDDGENSVRSAIRQFEGKKQQQPLQEIKPSNSTGGIEAILGATSRDSTDDNDDEDRRSNVSTSFLQSRSIFSPNMRKGKSPLSSQDPTPRSLGRVNIKVQGADGRSEASHSTLGARPMQKVEVVADDRSTLSSVMRRAGRYDVYAPSGPIGIVVDTSKDGPSVHSLKATSPMLGLISPGDLIVALDGQDTRKMTAAALTRLMSLKSRQKDRKITLLSK